MSSRAAAVNRITPKIFLIEDHPDFRSARKRSAGATAPVMAPRQCGRVTSFLPSTAATRLRRSSLRIPQRHRRRGSLATLGAGRPPTPRHSNRRTCPELRPKCARRTKSIGSPREASFDAAPSVPDPRPHLLGAARARGAVVTGCPPDRPARLAFDGQARAEGRGCASSSILPWTLLLWLASVGNSKAPHRRSTGANIFIADEAALPWTHLSLSRVSRTCRLPGAPLRKAVASERRSPDLDVELRASRRSPIDLGRDQALPCLATRKRFSCRNWLRRLSSQFQPVAMRADCACMRPRRAPTRPAASRATGRPRGRPCRSGYVRRSLRDAALRVGDPPRSALARSETPRARGGGAAGGDG